MRFKKRSSALFCERELKKALVSGKNIIFSKEGVASRPGMKPLENPIVFEPSSYTAGYPEFILTDISLHIDEDECRIGITIEDDSMSNVYYHFSALFADRISSLGTITFTRTSHESFPLPSSYIIFEGQPTLSSGIYFMTRVIGGEEASYQIYELNLDRRSWQILSESEFYVPTLLKFGRGFLSTTAMSEDNLKLSTPIEPESINMLTGAYKAEYTTDGHSRFFVAPKFPLVGKIECHLTLGSGSTVDWEIKSGETCSEFMFVDGAKMRLRCDRERGKLITDNEQGFSEPIPFYGFENNICFTLEADRKDTVDRAFSLSMCRRIFANSAAQTGAVTVFSGSKLYPRDIVWNTPEKPLYFPEKNRLSLAGKVTSLCPINGRLAVFETDNITLVGATVKAPLSPNATPPIILSAGQKSELRRKIIPETVAESEDKLYFCTTDGEFYSADSTASVKAIASLKDLLPQRGIMYGRKYLLIRDQNLFCFDTEESAGLLIPWEMPTKILSAINFSGHTVFYHKDPNDRILAYTLSGELDEIGETPLPIQCFFEAALLDEPRRSRLHGISVSGNGKPFELTLLSEDKELMSLSFAEDTKRTSLSAAFDSLSARLSFLGGREFRKIGLKFSRFSKL